MTCEGEVSRLESLYKRVAAARFKAIQIIDGLRTHCDSIPKDSTHTSAIFREATRITGVVSNPEEVEAVRADAHDMYMQESEKLQTQFGRD